MTDKNSPRRGNAEGPGSASSTPDRNGFAQKITSVTPLGGALDGTPRPKRHRAPRKAAEPVNGVVATAFACSYCATRLAERSAYLAHLNAHIAELAAEVEEVRANGPRRSDGYRQVSVCGEVGGYRRHLRLRQPPCTACKAANSAAQAAYRLVPDVGDKLRARDRARYAARKTRALETGQ